MDIDLPFPHPNNTPGNTRITAAILSRTRTPFDDITVVDRNTQLNLSSDHPLSERNDIHQNVTHDPTNSRYTLTTDPGTDQDAYLETVKRLYVTPGYAAEAGLAVHIPTPPTGNHDARFGLWEPNYSGTYVGYDSTGVYVETIRNGTRQGRTYQDDWNGESLTTPPETLLSKGTIIRVKPYLYNHGTILVEFFDRLPDGRAQFRTVHRERPDTGTTWADQSNAVRVEAANNGEDTALTVHVADRQAGIRGQFLPKDRVNGEMRGSVSLTDSAWTPVLSFRRKTGFRGMPIELFSFQAFPADSIDIQVRSDALTDPDSLSWTAPSRVEAGETAIETLRTDHSGSASIDDGHFRFQTGILGGRGSQRGVGNIRGIDPSLNRQRPMTVFMRRQEVGSTTVSRTFVSWQEGW